MASANRLGVAEPADYLISLAGVLDAGWAAAMDGMAVVAVEADDGSVVTMLKGRVPDQAALLGILNLAYSLGLCLLSVRCVPDANQAR